MKINNPKSRSHLAIKSKFQVLEVGPGNYPHPRANVLADKFIDDNYHRSGDLKVLKNQVLIEADGHDLPFADNEFDYVICSHVLEHAEDPIKFVSELTRVAPMGYLETPSVIGEYLMPKESHKWLIQEIDNKIVMYEKVKVNFNPSPDIGYIFQHFLPKQSIGFKIMDRTHAQLTKVVYEWKGEIEILVNPDSEYYRGFFTKPVTKEMCERIFNSTTLTKEFFNAISAGLNIVWSVINSKIFAIKKSAV